jgi:hypothetical protein
MLECFSLSASRLYGFLELAMVWDSRSSASLRPKAMHTPLAEQLHVALEVAGAFNVPLVPARGKPWGRRRAGELVSFSPQRLTNRNQLFTSKTDFLNRQFDLDPGLELGKRLVAHGCRPPAWDVRHNGRAWLLVFAPFPPRCCQPLQVSRSNAQVTLQLASRFLTALSIASAPQI